MSLRIGLIGAPGAGKDTFAEFLVNHKDFKRLAFADQIKKEYFESSNITEDDFKRMRGLPEEQTIRNDLWAYSDVMRKKYDNLHFINPIIDEASRHSGNIVITDVRTKDELEQMRKIQANMIIIIRDLKLDPVVASNFPGTRLNFRDIMGIPVLWNHANNIDTSHSEFELFYQSIIKFF